jgi:hypothetical protein
MRVVEQHQTLNVTLKTISFSFRRCVQHNAEPQKKSACETANVHLFNCLKEAVQIHCTTSSSINEWPWLRYLYDEIDCLVLVDHWCLLNAHLFGALLGDGPGGRVLAHAPRKSTVEVFPSSAHVPLLHNACARDVTQQCVGITWHVFLRFAMT